MVHWGSGGCCIPRAKRAKRAKANQSQSAGGGDQKSGKQKSAEPIKPVVTRQEIAKVASYAIWIALALLVSPYLSIIG
jgi:hypothetical protein